jgi:glycosyltransferase involved in cell wall biosynthesis
MKYSVIIPALNEEENIALCITEVKKQAPSAEIIIVDGISTDKTVEIAKNLGAITLHEKKKTIAAGRNKGLKFANGDIVCYIDADTIPEKNWFKKIIYPFEDESVIAVGGMAQPLDGTSLEKIGLNLVFGVISPIFFKFGIPLVTGQNMAFRKNYAVKAGGFNTNQNSGEDTSIFLRMKKYGKIVHSKSVVKVSMRRLRKWGLTKYLLFNIKNFVKLLIFDKPINENYEPVRNN